MSMWLKNNFLQRSVRLLVAVGMIFSSVPIPNVWAEDEISISGEWEVFYEDRELGGGVKGRAIVSEDESSVEVVLEHPDTGEKYTLNSIEIRRDKDNIEIVLEGRSPESGHVDGYGYPQQAITVPNGSSKISVSVGDNKAEKAVKPRKSVDLDRVTIKFIVRGYNQLQGIWSYEAEPITERDQDGYGRVGRFEFNDDGTGLQQGWEVWRRPEQLIVGSLPINYQKTILRDLRIPAYPHPFMNNENQDKYIRRTILIFGKNFPKDWKSAKLESGSEFVTYGNAVFPDGPFLLPGDLNPFVRGKKKLLEHTKPEEHEALLKLDFLVVKVKILKGILPGLQSFKLNGQESTWMLEFGDNRASVNFVRKINPDLPRNRIYIWKNSRTGKVIHQVGDKQDLDQFDNPWRLIRKPYPDHKNQWIYHWKNTKTGEERATEGPRKDFVRPANPDNTWKFVREVIKEYEDTQYLFIPEYTRVEVRTELVLDVDKIDVTIGKNGKVLKFGKSPLVPAYRSSSDPRVYQTQEIALIKASGPSLPPSTSKFSITVKEKDLLTTSIAETGLISVVPPPAKAVMSTTPARVPGRISYLWKDYLLEAAICHDIEIKDWDRSNNVFVDKISKWLILSGTKLETRFQLGDHAAMLLARQVFLEMINETIYSFANDYQTDKQLWSFWLYIDPFRRNSIKHQIHNYDLDITVTGKDGKEITFSDTFYDEGSVNRNPENSEPWVVNATRDALKQYVEILVESRARVEQMDSCDVEDLLMLTGNTFGAVEDRLVSRLMRLEEGQGTLSWKPDGRARLWVNSIAGTFDSAKSYERLSEADTQNLLAAAAIITLPLHIGTGPIVGFIIAFSEVAFESALVLDKYLTSQAEIEFAQGTADVLGSGRYQRAKAEEFDTIDLVVQVGIIIGLEWGGGKLFEVATESAVASIKQTYKSFQRGVRRSRVWRGKALLKKFDFDLDAVPNNLKPADMRNISEYVMDSALVRNARRTLDDDQLKVLRNLDKKSAQYNRKKLSEMTPEEREAWREALQARHDARASEVVHDKWNNNGELIAGGDSPLLEVPDDALQSIDTEALVNSMSDAEIAGLFEGDIGRILSREDIIKRAAVIKEGKVPDWAFGKGKGSDEVMPPVKREPTSWSEGDTVLGKGDTLPPPDISPHRLGPDGRPLADGSAGRAHESLDTAAKQDMGEGVPEDLLDIYWRRGGDIEELMESGSETVRRALRGEDRDLALQILRSSPQRTPEQFQRALDLRKRMVKGDKTARYMDQASEADPKSLELLKDGHRDFKIEGPDNHGFYKVRELDADGSPNTAKKAYISSKFEDGTFTMSEAFIYDSKPWIDLGMDIPLVSGKGVPTIQFMFLRIMKKFGIGFGGSGEKLTKVVLDNVVNTPTTIHVHWIRRTYFLGKTLKELEGNPQFEMLVMETPAVVMAKDLLEKAGYEVTGLRIKATHTHTPPVRGVMKNYKPLKGEESAGEFLDRFRLPEDEKVLVSYDIELEVKPLKGAEKPKKPLIVEEFDPDTPDGLDDVLQPKKPLTAEKWDPNAVDVDDWAPEYLKNAEIERAAREKGQAELMKRRVDAPDFKVGTGRSGRKKIGHLVEGDNGRLKAIMYKYKAVQPHVYEGNINKYAQDMINKRFDWDTVKPGDRITFSPDGKTVVHGHHRFIAAHLASEATGRPVRGGKNPIIPENGFAPPKKPLTSMDNFDIEVRKGFKDE